IFNTVPGVRRTALVGMSAGDRTLVGLCVERDGSRPWPMVEAELREIGKKFDTTQYVVELLDYPGTFPVDVRHNSKIFREKLAVWADKNLGPHRSGPSA